MKIYSVDLLEKSLILRGLAFDIEQTTYTKTIIWDGRRFTYSHNFTDIDKYDLNFISNIKNKVINYDEIKDNEYKIKYFKFTNTFNYKKVYEIDLKGAYWHFSKNYLQLEFYRKGLEVKKKVRLMSLGNLAKKTHCIHYDGQKYNYIETKIGEYPNVFYHSASKVSEHMQILYSLIKKPAFFWVDAIFTPYKKDLLLIKSYLDDNKIEYKEKDCGYMKRLQNGQIEVETIGNNPRIFTPSKKLNLDYLEK